VNREREPIARLRGGAAALCVAFLMASCAATETEAKVPGADDGKAPGKAVGSAQQAGKRGAAASAPRMNARAAAAYEAGLAAFRAGDMKGAEAQFRAATAADANAYEAHYALGTTLERASQVDEALSAYRRSIEVYSGFGPGIEALTRLCLATQRAGEAEAVLNRLRSKNGETAPVLAALAEVKSVQKDSAEAQSLAQQALKVDPDYRPAMGVLARDHYRNRRLDLALYTLTAILDGYGSENPPRDKNNAEARLLRALIYKEQGLRKPAIDELRRAVELRPDLIEARLNLAAYMLEAGNAAEALPILEGALKYDPANVLVHLNLGDAYRLQGRPGEALKQLAWVTQAAPKLAQAHYNLGLVYLFSTNIEGMTPEAAVAKAITEFETYQKMQPRTRPGAGDDAAELLARAKNKKAVLEAMKAEPEPAADGTSEAAGDGF
jgi:tetratricopeptide (TPR) repeat protein